MKYSVLTLVCLLLLACSPLQQRNSTAVKKKTYKIAVISDLNSGYGSTVYHPDVYATLKELDSIKPDIILCGGDMVAGQKRTITAEQTQAMWDSFGKNILQPIKDMKIPFGFTVGNHDAAPSFPQDRAIAKQFWQTHQKELNLNYVDQTNFPFYFSYQHNDIFFISWDAAGTKVPTEIFDWMEQQLQSTAAKKAKLRILIGHLPLYAIVAAKNKPGEVLADNEKTATFFQKNGLDLYISGHQHSFFPSYTNKLKLLNLGCIGEGDRPLMGHDRPATKAYTIIEVPMNDAKNFNYQTFIPSTKQTIPLSALPDSVIGFNGISRKDKR